MRVDSAIFRGWALALSFLPSSLAGVTPALFYASTPTLLGVLSLLGSHAAPAAAGTARPCAGPTVAVPPAGPLTLCAGSSQTLTTTATIPGFNAGSGFDGYVSALLVQPDSKLLVGGTFTSYNGNTAAPDNLLFLTANGSLDTSFNAGGSGASDQVVALAMQADGKVLAGGRTTSDNGNTAPDKLLRLNPDGSLHLDKHCRALRSFSTRAPAAATPAP